MRERVIWSCGATPKEREAFPWAYLDLNQGPHPYQGCALTRLSYRPESVAEATKLEVKPLGSTLPTGGLCRV